nr:hypothetical protein [uncultured bacterium]
MKRLALVFLLLLSLVSGSFAQQGMGPGPGLGQPPGGGGGGSTLSAKAGSFAEAVSTGNQSVTGVGFQPKLVLFWWNRRASDGTSADNEVGFGVGISSSARRAVGYKSVDASNPSNNSPVNQTTTCIYYAQGGAGKADFVSQDSDGFTINWSAVTGGGFLINYLALGGSSLTNTSVGTVTTPGSTGNQATTGLGYSPTALMFFAGKMSANDPLDGNTNGSFVMGMGTGSSAQGWSGERSKNNVSPQVAKHRQSTANIIGSTGDTSVGSQASLTSLDSDGFTLNFGTVSGSSDIAYYLAMRGPHVKVGNFNQATTTGNSAITGVGFTPKALLLLSANDTSANNDATLAHAQISFGAATSSSARLPVAGESDAVSTTAAERNLDRTKIIKLFSAGTPTLNAAADLVSFDSDGFTLNWTTADATARQIIYLAIGD